MKLYRPSNFKCPVMQQNWLHMVTEHTIHLYNFKVTGHFSTALFSQIPSALSVILTLSTSCYRKDIEMVTLFLHSSAQNCYFPIMTWEVRSRTRGSCPRFTEAGDARIPLKLAQHSHMPLLLLLATEKLRQHKAEAPLCFGLWAREDFLFRSFFVPFFFIAVTWDGQPWHHNGKNRTASAPYSHSSPQQSSAAAGGAESTLPQASPIFC